MRIIVYMLENNLIESMQYSTTNYSHTMQAVVIAMPARTKYIVHEIRRSS